eukprot:jgi/Mesen1/3201/ME000185S02341
MANASWVPGKPAEKQEEEKRSQVLAEKQWHKAAGMPSDLSIFIGSDHYALHKYPLYSKTDYFAQVAVDGESGKMKIDLTGLPGGELAFKMVVNFCYGFSFSVTPSNVAPLRCAASYLDMSDDARPGIGPQGNLVSVTDKYLEQCLADWRSSLAVLRSCQDLEPFAEGVGIVPRALQAISAFILAHFHDHQEGEEPIQAAGLPALEISSIIQMYGKCWLPDPQTYDSKAAPPDKPQANRWRRVVETLASVLPPVEAGDSLSFHLYLLYLAISLGGSKECRLDLTRQAGEHFEQAHVADLLALDVSDVQGLLAIFAASERLSQVAQPDVAVDRAAALIDGYLKEASGASAGVMTWRKFKELAQMLPEAARPLHDALYLAVDAFVGHHRQGLKEKDLLELLEMIAPSKLSEEVAEQASSNPVWPLPFIADVLAWQKQYYSKQAVLLLSQRNGLEAVKAREVAERERLALDVEELKRRYRESEAKVAAVKSALREETRHITEELLKTRALNESLKQKLSISEAEVEVMKVRKSSWFGTKDCTPKPKIPKAPKILSTKVEKVPKSPQATVLKKRELPARMLGDSSSEHEIPKELLEYYMN